MLPAIGITAGKLTRRSMTTEHHYQQQHLIALREKERGYFLPHIGRMNGMQARDRRRRICQSWNPWSMQGTGTAAVCFILLTTLVSDGPVGSTTSRVIITPGAWSSYRWKMTHTWCHSCSVPCANLWKQIMIKRSRIYLYLCVSACLLRITCSSTHLRFQLRRMELRDRIKKTTNKPEQKPTKLPTPAPKWTWKYLQDTATFFYVISRDWIEWYNPSGL